MNCIIIYTEPPGHPRIYKASETVLEGQPLRVMCTTTGGHPKPKLVWKRGSVEVRSAKLI